jgi:hypothetical protein
VDVDVDVDVDQLPTTHKLGHKNSARLQAIEQRFAQFNNKGRANRSCIPLEAVSASSPRRQNAARVAMRQQRRQSQEFHSRKHTDAPQAQAPCSTIKTSSQSPRHYHMKLSSLSSPKNRNHNVNAPPAWQQAHSFKPKSVVAAVAPVRSSLNVPANRRAW